MTNKDLTKEQCQNMTTEQVEEANKKMMDKLKLESAGAGSFRYILNSYE